MQRYLPLFLCLFIGWMGNSQTNYGVRNIVCPMIQDVTINGIIHYIMPNKLVRKIKLKNGNSSYKVHTYLPKGIKKDLSSANRLLNTSLDYSRYSGKANAIDKSINRPISLYIIIS